MMFFVSKTDPSAESKKHSKCNNKLEKLVQKKYVKKPPLAKNNLSILTVNSNTLLSASKHQKDDTVLSLKLLCTNFVVKNLQHVESFVDLPEIVGNQIFNSFAISMDCNYYLKDIYSWVKFVNLFVDAYKEVVLIELNLSEKWLFLNEFIDHLSPFVYLQKLDLSSCRIGNNHDILSNIGKLTFLEILFLNNNFISNEGIKLLTLFRRRAGKGLNNLRFIRLENNDICFDSLLYLQLLPMLHVVVVDNTVIHSSPSSLISKVRFKVCSKQNDPHELSNATIKNVGWAVPVLHNLENFIIEEKKLKNHQSCSLQNSCAFYKSKKMQKVFESCYKQNDCSVNVLCDSSNHHLKQVENVSNNFTADSSRKRLHSYCCNSEQILPISKKSNISLFSVESAISQIHSSD